MSNAKRTGRITKAAEALSAAKKAIQQHEQDFIEDPDPQLGRELTSVLNTLANAVRVFEAAEKIARSGT